MTFAHRFSFTQALAENRTDAMVVCDVSQTDAPIVFANAAFSAMTGYTAEQIIGQNCRFLQGHDRDQPACQQIRQAMQTSASIRITLRNYRRDGSMFWNELTLYPLQDEEGFARYYGGVQRDVSALFATENALRNARNELELRVRERTAELVCANALLRQEISDRMRTEQALIDTKTILTIIQRGTQLGSWSYDITSERFDWSDEVFSICGLIPQSVKPTLDLATAMIHPEDRAATTAAFRQCLLDGRDYRMDRRVVRPDGSIRFGRLWGKVIRDEFNQPVRLVGSYLDITEHREIEQALRSSQENLRLLRAHQERIKEDERKRIAREIHDELGGLLTGIKAHLSVAGVTNDAGTTASSSLIEEASRLADAAIGTVQRVITDLRPSVLDDLGIWTAIEWYVERTAYRAGLNFDLDIDAETAAIELDPERSIALFRIVQEALTNVQRHAHANAVSVAARRNAHGIELTIGDDGCGIAAAEIVRQHSWGLAGMRERIGHFGGSIEFLGDAGKGTVVSVRMPLPVGVP